MNLPNKITVVRLILVPFFLACALMDFKHHFLFALIIFAIACITDRIDGKLARDRNEITNFGKFLDPLVDKILTTSALLAFIPLGNKHIFGIVWLTFLVLLREFAVMGIRLSALSESGEVVAADVLGKIKTILQMFSICFILFVQWLGTDFSVSSLKTLEIIGAVLLWISTLMALISGINYIKNNSKNIKLK